MKRSQKHTIYMYVIHICVRSNIVSLMNTKTGVFSRGLIFHTEKIKYGSNTFAIMKICSRQW